MKWSYVFLFVGGFLVGLELKTDAVSYVIGIIGMFIAGIGFWMRD
jgi:hypothetical protein